MDNLLLPRNDPAWPAADTVYIFIHMHVLTKHACRLFCQTTCVYIRTCPPYEPQALFFIQEHYSAAVTLLNATEKLTIIVANNLDPGRMFTFASNNIGAQSTHNTHTCINMTICTLLNLLHVQPLRLGQLQWTTVVLCNLMEEQQPT